MPGYDINLQENKVGGELICTLCARLLRQPVQTICGHRCCVTCVKEWKGNSDSYSCPEDNELVKEVFPDRFVEREVLNLKVKCSNLKAGCKWLGTVRHFEQHVSSCPFAFVKCTNEGCQLSVARGEFTKHVDEECRHRNVECHLCKYKVIAIDMKKHQEVKCPNFMVKCSQCGKEFKRAQITSHQETECEEAIIKCPFSSVGCAATRPMKKQERRKHMENALSNHVTYILTFLLEIWSKTKSLLEQKDNQQTMPFQAEELQVAFEIFKSQYAFFLQRLEKLELQLSNRTSPSKGTASASGTEHVSAPFDDTTRTQQIKNIACKLLGYESLVDELNKKISNQEKSIDALKDWNRRLETKINSLEHELALKSITMAEQNDKLDTVEQASYNGILIWPIEGFMKKRHDAIIGKTVSLYSPVFYTDRHGYKLRVRIYLNGDGLGKGTHISLFFVVCKRRYDTLLPWPFRQKVKMMILDQDTVEHVVDSFKPDPMSSSFQKPRNEMNVASGCPLFMPLAHLDTRSFVRDDTMFVKVVVDANVPDHAN